MNACWKFICSTLIATFTAKTSRCDSCSISDRNESSTVWRRWRNKSTSMCGGHANCARQMMRCLGLQFACLRDGSDSSGSHNQQTAAKRQGKQPYGWQRNQTFHRDDEKASSIRSNVSQRTREQGGCQENRATKRPARATGSGQLLQHAGSKAVVIDIWRCLTQLSI